MSDKTNRTRPIKIEFFVNTEEKELIQKKAKNFNSLSDYLRRITIKGKVILPAPATDRETLMQLSRIGNNINQLVHLLHKAEMNILNRKVKKDLEDNLKSLQEVLKENYNKLDGIINK
jgi:hypothetical protein